MPDTTKSQIPRTMPPHLKNLVEVVDQNNAPLLVMPLKEAHKQSLSHRAVIVFVYNNEKKLFIQKRSKQKRFFPGRWDLSATGHVFQGEAREEAALRLLKEHLGLELHALKHITEIPATQETNHEYVTLFSTRHVHHPLQFNPTEIEGGSFVDHDELAYLVEHFRELLTPGLVHFSEQKYLFPT